MRGATIRRSLWRGATSVYGLCLLGLMFANQVVEVEAQGEDGWIQETLERGWLVRRAQEAALFPLLGVLRQVAGQINEEYMEAKKAGQIAGGNGRIHRMTGGFLRVCSQAQTIMLHYVKNKRF